MKKPNKKHINGSARANFWDYDWNGSYFVTIFTKNRGHFFGEIENSQMQLSAIGQAASNYWLQIPDHSLFVELGVHVIMPNHIHGIIKINKSREEIISEKKYPSLLPTNSRNIFGPQSRNLASIVRGFKVGVTKEAKRILPYFGWQKLYHDHIIRDERAYHNIHNYIINNPQKWNDDCFRQ
ncbi:transposase [Aureibacter tunicatorum]|uniref:REP element-mobilizing transposase RayT n=1 Tax=Aureibacter tunicatorum TaxID=866807 RepID=A0AAE4BQP2_9BACT|nr:transposase [Aureibacter tunicatorum]MDR6237791.1 REP element-mobilizing transposase RayT [Aureibacter tunicatorum]BDD02826.1 hypothetical protein AUTU_03090 [Aureibacter tunicatorum]